MFVVLRRPRPRGKIRRGRRPRADAGLPRQHPRADRGGRRHDDGHREMHGLCHRPRQLAADERRLFFEFRRRTRRIGCPASSPASARRNAWSRSTPPPISARTDGGAMDRAAARCELRCSGRCRPDPRANPKACRRARLFSSWRWTWPWLLALARLGRRRLGGLLGQTKSSQLLGLRPGWPRRWPRIRPSPSCRPRPAAPGFPPCTLFGSSANGMPFLWISALYGAERAFIQPQSRADAPAAAHTAAECGETALVRLDVELFHQPRVFDRIGLGELADLLRRCRRSARPRPW